LNYLVIFIVNIVKTGEGHESQGNEYEYD